MRVMFTISADEAGSQKAEELKNKIADLVKEYGLTGAVRGEGYAKGASYTGSYNQKAGKAAKKGKADKPKWDPKYDPSQYFKPKLAKKEE